ncbi:hypothetical protein PC111_g24584 [Phytophthora cactorum]|nr:hypothetical protein PC111_g24584 [Phytophthora cactorum]KAG3044563.1 hypothetical protein PC122_g24818 [Phytophthora cactorum]KAG4036633.1 hypothetical protein PC123_g27798 [Phytophthora cactorum]
MDIFASKTRTIYHCDRWATINFENVVSGLCRRWLNDSPIDFCLTTIAESVGKCYALSALSWGPELRKSRS